MGPGGAVVLWCNSGNKLTLLPGIFAVDLRLEQKTVGRLLTFAPHSCSMPSYSGGLMKSFSDPNPRSVTGTAQADLASAPDDPLVILQARGAARPFFCAHPIGGTAFCYLALARHLGEKRPFYAFQSKGIDDDSMPFLRIEDKATHYPEATRRVLPRDPHFLG